MHLRTIVRNLPCKKFSVYLLRVCYISVILFICNLNLKWACIDSGFTTNTRVSKIGQSLLLISVFFLYVNYYDIEHVGLPNSCLYMGVWPSKD